MKNFVLSFISLFLCWAASFAAGNYGYLASNVEFTLQAAVAASFFFFLISLAIIIANSTDEMGKLRTPHSLWTLLGWIMLIPQGAIAIGGYLNYQSSLSIILAASNSRGAEVFLVRDNMASLNGEIGFGTPETLKNLYLLNPFSLLNISSNGGLINPAVEMGEFLSENGIDTLVTGSCESACVIVALYGAQLYVSSNAQFGFHRGSAPASAESQLGKHIGDLATQDLIKILRKLRVPKPILERLEKTPSDEMFYLSGARLFELGLANHLVD